jgi:ABC-type antimicrobial peptide transport system permease subunit
MYRNYFKIAIRNIRRYSAHSSLNIIGMAIGMAFSILLLLWVRNELSYDRFRSNANELYRVVMESTVEGKTLSMATTPGPLAYTLKDEFPEIRRSSRYNNVWSQFPKGEDIIEGTMAYIDKDFFEMFEIRFIQGDSKTALKGPDEIVLTEEMAKNYFGNENAMGKTMILWPNHPLTVSGIIEKQPRNSHLYINSLLSTELLKRDTLSEIDNWKHSGTTYSFIELVKGTDTRLLEDKIKNIISRHSAESNSKIFLQNIKRIRLHSSGKYINDIELGSIRYVRMALLLAFALLAISCINFMNLTTAIANRRSKEIGIRKVAGAKRYNLIIQFLAESLLIVFIAHIIAMILVELALPAFNSMLFSEIRVDYLSLKLYAGLFTVIIVTGLLAGSYPSFYLSSSGVLNNMKGTNLNPAGNARFRKILVVVQFVVSFMLILCTMIIKSQLNYMNNSDLGLNIHNICRFSYQHINPDYLKKDLAKNPDILGITVTSESTISAAESTGEISWPGKSNDEKLDFNIIRTDENYLTTFDIKLREGRTFSTENTGDKNAILINEKAAESMGLKNAIGEYLSYKGTNLQIIGVVKNYHFQWLRSQINPLIIMRISPEMTNGICNIKIKPDRIPQTIAYIRNTFKSYNQDYPLNIGFLDNDNKSQYFIEQTLSMVLGFVTILAILISCLGLLGLSSFMTVNRTKEIGIRKTNGAKSTEIFLLLSGEYIKLITIAFLIAAPLVWFSMRLWLQSYAYHTKVSVSTFIISWLIVMLITLLTVFLQSKKAAGRNPVEALRYE